jgi:ABC-2 type transport system ATP-binding protein
LTASVADRPAIEIEDLSVKRGGRRVVEAVNLVVAAGAVTGLLGPSGSGKTTLMRSIVGVQRVDHGRVAVLGAPAGSAGLRARVAYQPQGPSVYADLSVEENLRYFATIVGARHARVAEVLETVRLSALRRQVVGSLSGGELARVSLAVALVGDPDLLVLDEPTVGLDPVLRSELWAGFHRLAATGTTLLVSSHVMDEAAECDALLLMRDGAILARTTPAALRRAPGEDDLGRAFLAVIRGAT